MDPVERSRLLFLVDALCGAPRKSGELLAMAAAGGSPPYMEAIRRLQTVSSEPDALVALGERMKRELF